MFGQARELFPQCRILCRNPDRTGIQMALAHHDAAKRDQRRGGKSHLLGTEQRCDYHVATGLQAAVRLQHGPAAQVVHDQGLVSLGDPEFPRQTGMLDARQRRSAGTAGVAGNQNVIGMRLYDTCSNRSDANFRHQFDADASCRVCVFQVVDQLGEILDRIDVVMGRWADQPNPRCRIPDACDDLIHFLTRQFAALARLGALRHLDLKFVGVGKIERGDAEAAGSDLLDGRTA